MTQLSNFNTGVQVKSPEMPVPEPAAPPFPTAPQTNDTTSSTLEPDSSGTVSPEETHTDRHSSSDSGFSPEKEDKDKKFVPPPSPPPPARSSTVSSFQGARPTHRNKLSPKVIFIDGSDSFTIDPERTPPHGNGTSPTSVRFQGASHTFNLNNRPSSKPNNRPFPKCPRATPGNIYWHTSTTTRSASGMGPSIRIQNTPTAAAVTNYTSASAAADDNANSFAPFGGDKFGNNARTTPPV